MNLYIAIYGGPHILYSSRADLENPPEVGQCVDIPETGFFGTINRIECRGDVTVLHCPLEDEDHYLELLAFGLHTDKTKLI